MYYFYFSIIFIFIFISNVLFLFLLLFQIVTRGSNFQVLRKISELEVLISLYKRNFLFQELCAN